MLASGRSTKKALLATLAIGAATLAGVVAVVLLEGKVNSAVAYALPFSAGVTLYVAASDLIPEVNQKEERNPMVSIVVFAGAALFYLLHRMIEVCWAPPLLQWYELHQAKLSRIEPDEIRQSFFSGLRPVADLRWGGRKGAKLQLLAGNSERFRQRLLKR